MQPRRPNAHRPANAPNDAYPLATYNAVLHLAAMRLDLNPSPGYYDRSWTHVQRLRTGAPAPAPAR